METKLQRIAEMSKKDAGIKFTSIYHMMNEELLLECHKELSKKKAVGIDGISKEEYSENLEKNLKALVKKLVTKSYKPSPVKRVQIPKDNGKTRPLGIAIYEDKIVQLALKKIIEAIYEPRFLECMYGFRPSISCHDAVKKLNYLIENQRTNWIYDADIKGYFDNLSHEWIMKTLGVHIGDTNIMRLVNRFLKAGIIEDGVYEDTDDGAIQGGNLSPLIANIYMHYMLTLWFYKVVKPQCKGQCDLVVYADDFVVCFQYKEDILKFNDMVNKRMEMFGLELEPTKTRMLEFGKYANENQGKRNKRKAETFDFLGFTHYCSKSQKGWFRVKRKTSKKKFRAKVKNFKEWLIKARTLPLKTLMEKVNLKLLGHYRYYGITDNSKMIRRFYNEVEKLLYKWLNRRSQRNSYNFEKFRMMLKLYPLLKPKIYVSVYGE
ncbi:MAG: group II intron reverse transcriptase/maturase [Clostridiales bacterium]|nr:group II intron reverse transcriptase/maturase [Clostridiales bacterium]